MGLLDWCIQSFRELAITRRLTAIGIAVAVLMGVVGMTARARTPSGPESIPVATPGPVPAASALAPSLAHVTPQAVLRPGRPTVINLSGDHFAPGVTVTLQSEWYVYTFGRESVSARTSHAVDLAIVDVQPGTYAVTICNPDGRRSAPLPLVLKIP